MWQHMTTAPKGQVEDGEPSPRILLRFPLGEVSVAYWDWAYAVGGHYYDGGLAWIEPVSGERLDQHYGQPYGWMPLPA